MTDIITLTDSNGAEEDFTLLEVIPLDGSDYAVLSPCEEDEGGILILRIVRQNGEEYFDNVDETMQQRVYDAFCSGDEDYRFCDAE